MKLEEIKVIVPSLKPKNPNHRVLTNKANAAGTHRDKKSELKRGVFKHKGKMHEDIEQGEGQ